ncbi:MAG: hypothetical protein ACREN7_01665 [Candidatus Dormibacteria bacterium]
MGKVQERVRPIPIISPSERVVLGRRLRDRCLLWSRFAVAGFLAGGAAALEASSWPDAFGVGLAAAGLALLGVEGLHKALKTRSVVASTIRSEVARNPTLAYLVPLPAVTAVTVASSRGMSVMGMAVVITAGFAFTWLVWEAAIAIVGRWRVAYRLVTHWQVKANVERSRRAAAAESRWRDRPW